MDISESYSVVAQDYTRRIYDELKEKPKDRELLDSFAEIVGEEAFVADLGCGPGQVAAYLAGRGLNPVGVDISEGMIKEAKILNPSTKFFVGDIQNLPFQNNELDGAVAFYSLIHIEKNQLIEAFKGIRRVLKPKAPFLFSFHIGNQTVTLDEWWEHKVDLDFHFFASREITEIVQKAGFRVTNIVERDPYDVSVEHQSRRAYFLIESTK